MTIPRLYVNFSKQDDVLKLSDNQIHYLKHVLRIKDKDDVHVFCEQEGEWGAKVLFSGKHAITLVLSDQIKEPKTSPFLALAFAPLKQDETRLVVEKATELGVTDIYPIQTQHVQTHRIAHDKLEQVIIKASEQCERLCVPTLHPMIPLMDLLNKKDFHFYVALERSYEGIHTSCSLTASAPCFVVGPEGGFSAEEKRVLSTHSNSTVLSLGETILRAETASIALLSIYRWGMLCQK